MKRERLLSALLGTAMAFCLSVGSIGCLISGFSLPIGDGNRLTLLCAAASLAGAVLFSWKWGGYAAAGALALLGGYLWRRGIVLDPVLSLVSRISRVYHSAYGWGYPELTVEPLPADIPMALLALLIALAAARTVCMGKGTYLTALLCTAPLAACMVVTDTVPAVSYLLPLFTGLLMLIFTAGLRREDLFQSNRLLILLALPVLAGVLLLFRLIPQEGYVNRSAEVREAILSEIEALPQRVETAAKELSVVLSGDGQKELDLKQLGKRNLYTYPVMEVTAEQGGLLYLRGQDYDSYSGTGWTAAGFRAEDFGLEGVPSGSVTVRTRSPKEFLYLPYYPAQSQTLTGGLLPNTPEQTAYTFPCTALPQGWQEPPVSPMTGPELTDLEVQAFGSTAQRLRYVSLPGQTRVRAKEILAAFLPEDAHRVEAAQAIARYVSSCAEYDLDTQRMPAGETDFALWFLDSGETGYCVHFATAAVVLLRAADIPARYVSGYLVRTQPGQTVTVTAASAHAWAEYYVPHLNAWVVLEATPGEALYIPEETASAETSVPAPVPEASGEEAFPVPGETVPAPSAPTETAVPPDRTPEQTGSPLWLLWLLVPLFVPGQYLVRRNLHSKLRRKGTPNRQALYRWQETERLSRLLRQPPPEVLHALAEKARFSQHTLTAEELSRFDAYREECIRKMRQQALLRQLLYRLLWAVY